MHCLLATAESCLVSDELLQYRHFASKQQFDKDLTDEQEEEVLGQFSALDPEKKGHIEWSDFLYFESLVVLRKFRSEVQQYIKKQVAYIQNLTAKQGIFVCECVCVLYLRNR